MAARVYNAAEVKQDLYDRITSDGEVILLLGNTSKGDSAVTLWQYDASSSAADSFTNGIIKPTLQTGNGRWIRQGNYPVARRQEVYSGSTNGSGNYTVAFPTAYAVAPNIQANIIGGTDLQRSRITNISTTGFTVNVVAQNTTTVALVGLVLIPGVTAASGVSIDVLITEK